MIAWDVVVGVCVRDDDAADLQDAMRESGLTRH